MDLSLEQALFTERIQPNSLSLPLDQPVAVYFRQSSSAQIGNTSTVFQFVDLVDAMLNLGWQRDQIIYIDTDAGLKGSLRLADRPGMVYLLELIQSRSIGLLAVSHVDRLFRDLTQIDTNTFIDLCRGHNVRVYTPTFLYDFAAPVYGRYHQQIFRSQAQAAADFIQTYNIDRLYRGRDLIWRAGCWCGGWIPLGYVVDMRKFIPTVSTADSADKTPALALAPAPASAPVPAKQLNPAWRKFVPFEPCAVVVREYFRLAAEFACNQTRLREYLFTHGPFAPRLGEVDVPDGFLFKSWLTHKSWPNEYAPTIGKLSPPSVKTLGSILTNANYIGHWIVRGQVTHWNNHEPIVPLDLFMSIFERLSPTDFEGRDNPNYVNRSKSYPKSTFNERSRPDKPLYADVTYIVDSRAPSPRPLLPAHSRWWSDRSHYVYRIKVEVGLGRYREESMSAPRVDEVVKRLLSEKLEVLGWLRAQQVGQRSATATATATATAPTRAGSLLSTPTTSMAEREKTSAAQQHAQDHYLDHSSALLTASGLPLDRPGANESRSPVVVNEGVIASPTPVPVPVSVSLPVPPRALEDILLRWPEVAAAQQRMMFDAIAVAIWIDRDLVYRSRRTISVLWKDGDLQTWNSTPEPTGTEEDKRQVLAWRRQMDDLVQAQAPQVEFLKAFPNYTWGQLIARYSRSSDRPWTQLYQGKVRYARKTRWQDVVAGTARRANGYKETAY